jgi:hypothetical protein
MAVFPLPRVRHFAFLSIERLEDRLLLDASSVSTLLAGLGGPGRARAEAVLAALGPLDSAELTALRVDADGNVYYHDALPKTADPIPPADEPPDGPPGPSGPEPDGPISEVPIYHSPMALTLFAYFRG